MAIREINVGGSDEKFAFTNPGDALSGYYIGDGKVTIDGKEVTKHMFQTEAGETLSPLTNYNLGKGLAQVPVGTFVTVTYTELKQLKGKKTCKIFKFAVDDDKTIPVNGISRPQTTAEKIQSLKSVSA